MNKRLFLIGWTVALLTVSCSDDKEVPYPEIVSLEIPSSVCYGDAVAFTVKVADASALHNVTVSLINGNEVVSQATAECDADGVCTGRIYVPSVKNLGDTRLTAMALALDKESRHVEVLQEVSCSHRDYPYIDFVADDGETFRFSRLSANEYGYTGNLPGQLSGYFASPVPSDDSYARGERQLFWGSDGASDGTVSNINLIASDDAVVRNVTLSYNTLSYEAKVPMLPATFVLGSDRASVTKTLRQGQTIFFEGLDPSTWIDVDFFRKDGDHYVFRAEEGSYRVTREDEFGYIRVERMNGNDYAGFSEDGDQLAIWCIGNAEFGKPDKNNKVDWNTDRGLCMAKTGPHTYELTVKLYLGLSIKFFWQKGWGGEFGGTDYASVESAWFGVNGSGNFEQMVDGQIVATQYTNDDKYYRITIDASDGVHAVKLKCEEIDL